MAGSAVTLSSKLGSILGGSGLSESQQGMLDSLNKQASNLIPTPQVDITDPASVQAELERRQKAGDIQGAMAMQQQLRGLQAEQREAAKRSAQLQQPIQANGASERRDLEKRRALAQRMVDEGYPGLAGPARDGSLTELAAENILIGRDKTAATNKRQDEYRDALTSAKQETTDVKAAAQAEKHTVAVDTAKYYTKAAQQRNPVKYNEVLAPMLKGRDVSELSYEQAKAYNGVAKSIATGKGTPAFYTNGSVSPAAKQAVTENDRAELLVRLAEGNFEDHYTHSKSRWTNKDLGFDKGTIDGEDGVVWDDTIIEATQALMKQDGLTAEDAKEKVMDALIVEYAANKDGNYIGNPEDASAFLQNKFGAFEKATREMIDARTTDEQKIEAIAAKVEESGVSMDKVDKLYAQKVAENPSLTRLQFLTALEKELNGGDAK